MSTTEATAQAVAVTGDNFVRAEADMYSCMELPGATTARALEILNGKRKFPKTTPVT
jgi:hypothetical protein